MHSTGNIRRRLTTMARPATASGTSVLTTWCSTGGADGIVRAIDITAEGIDVQALLKAVIGAYRVHYVIYDRTIYSRTYGWKARPYAGSSPHDQHVHVSLINAGTKGYSAKQRRHAADDSTPWGIA